ncbi:MAG: DUF885 domain-containing protein [Candidatus Aminicenantes bacterium]|nr:DUF885 domain-containing protein [Candidatus Aminicenantes bacterium]
MKKASFMVIALAFILFSTNSLFTQQNKEDEKFQKVVETFFDELWKFYPTLATVEGFHKYDNKLEDMGEGSIEKRHDILDGLNSELVTKINMDALSPEYQIDFMIMRDGLDRELIKHEMLLPWAYDPLFYNQIFINSLRSLMTEEFAPLAERAKNAEERLKNLPKLIKQAKENLQTPPAIYTETAVQQFPGILNFYKTEMPELIQSAPADIKPKLDTELAKTITALEDYSNYLQTELLAKSTGNDRLMEAHRRYARITFQNNIPLEELVARAKADVNNVTREMALTSIPFFKVMYPEIDPDKIQRSEEEIRRLLIQGVFDKIKTEHVSKEEFFETIKNTAATVKGFIQEKQLLDLPDTELNFIEMPLYESGFCWAKLATPGIYEDNNDFAYKFSAFNGNLPEETTNSLLEEYNNYYLPFYVTLKIFPGPFVPYFFTTQNSNLLRKYYPNQALIKGWPVFVEEMLIFNDFGDYDLRLRFAQLKLRLKLAIDFILDFNIHETAMSKEDAVNYMTRVGFQTKAEAERNFNRILLMPVEAAYAYVGLQELLNMQTAYKQQKGDSYNQKEFLSEVLSYGAIPLRYLKDKLQ